MSSVAESSKSRRSPHTVKASSKSPYVSDNEQSGGEHEPPTSKKDYTDASEEKRTASLKRKSPAQPPKSGKTSKDKGDEHSDSGKPPETESGKPPLDSSRNEEEEHEESTLTDTEDAEDAEDARKTELDQGRKQHYEEQRLRAERHAAIEKRWNNMSQRVKIWWQHPDREIPEKDEEFMHEQNKKIHKKCEDLYKEEWRNNKDAREKAIEEQLEELKKGKEGNATNEMREQAKAIAYRKKLAKLKRDCTYPYQTLHGHIQTLTASLNNIKSLEYSKIKDLDDDDCWEEYNEKMGKSQTQLLNGVAVFGQLLEDRKIKASSVVSMTAYSEFTRLAANKDFAREWKRALNELEEPIKGHRLAWKKATPLMVTALETMAEPYSGGAGAKVETALTEMTSYDYTIKRINEANPNLNKETNVLPLSLIKLMKDEWEDGNDEGVTEELYNLVTQLRIQQASPDLIDDLKRVSKGKGKAKRKLTGKNKYDSTPTASGDDIALKTKVATTDNKSWLTTPQDLDIEELQEMENDFDEVIKECSYEDGNTEYGKHVATRASLTDSRYSRFIVNAGTAKLPYFRIITGMDLGPGGAEELEKKEQLRTEFNIRERKARLKADPSCISVRVCVVKDRSENYVPRGNKPRQPDTCVQIVWYEGEASEMTEWPSRTEFYSLMGRKHAQKHYMAKLETSYRRRTDYFESCRKHMIHPETKQPLTEKDRKESPWLFAPGSVLGNKRNHKTRASYTDSEAGSEPEDSE
jgi:hypothetical protein